MTKMIIKFLRDQSGATAIEYGLIAAGISVAIIATVQALGTSLNTRLHERLDRPQMMLAAAAWQRQSPGRPSREYRERALSSERS